MQMDDNVNGWLQNQKKNNVGYKLKIGPKHRLHNQKNPLIN
jgi:hypothetical protein